MTPQQKLFLTLAGSNLTYCEIADLMGKSERTVDGYRESLFKKYKVNNRASMVVTALKFKIITLNSIE